MTPFLIFGALVLLLLTGLPVAFALITLGTVLLLLKGLPLALVAQGMFAGVNDFVLLAVPLFLLMSNVLLRGGVGRDLFAAVQSWVGHWPGGLGVAAVLSCGVFSSISGSSVTTAATVGTVAIPEMTSRGYRRPFTMGLLAAGGTLGILIPPSIPLIVYGVITEQSISKLFLAGVGPGLLLIVLFSGYGVVKAKLDGGSGATPRANWSERLVASRRALPTVALASVMLGGIYTGIFTPTEASAIGCAMAILITAVFLRSLSWADFVQAVRDSVMTTTVIFLIVVCAKIFGKAITLYQLPAQVAHMFDTHVSSPALFMLIVALMLLFIGLFLESMSMLLIMVPVLFPAVMALGIDPIWFGIFFVVMIEIALITPPVGLNLFVIQAIARLPLGVVVTGVLPFVILMLVSVVLIYLIPGIVMFLPNNL